MELSRKAHTQVAGKSCEIGSVGSNRNDWDGTRYAARRLNTVSHTGQTVPTTEPVSQRMAPEVGRAAVERSLSRLPLPVPGVPFHKRRQMTDVGGMPAYAVVIGLNPIKNKALDLYAS